MSDTVLRAPEPIAPTGVHDTVYALAMNIPAEKVLDLPTGYGAMAERLLRAGKAVTGGDIDTGKFRSTRDDPRLTLLQLDLNEKVLPVPEGAFDLAISVEGIEHLQSQWNFVRSLNRALKPGGRHVRQGVLRRVPDRDGAEDRLMTPHFRNLPQGNNRHDFIQ